MNPGLRNLIALQDIDLKIVNLKKQIAEIPAKTDSCREEIQRMSQAYEDRVALHQENARQRRARESDVELMRTKLSRLKDQLMMVKTNKEYTAMLHEIQAAEDQIRSAEDGILEIMDQMESTEARLAREGTELQSRKAELESQIREAEQTAPVLEAEVADLNVERSALEATIDPDLLARYHRIAELRKGVALAEAKNELCSACHVRIRPQVVAELLRMDAIHICDSCSRILFVRESG